MRAHLIESLAVVGPQPVFVLNGITYVPHYRNPCWVQPGGYIKVANHMSKIDEYKEDIETHLSADDLFALGAEVQEDLLWSREWTKDWQLWLKPKAQEPTEDAQEPTTGG